MRMRGVVASPNAVAWQRDPPCVPVWDTHCHTLTHLARGRGQIFDSSPAFPPSRPRHTSCDLFPRARPTP
ncbi:hypothetical protein CBM2587_B90132 [Cupriavidus taiwanensis]|uniref:Uncharacterized protein n=1 Tax=Cupriavidus taiwanensis TaxID=164546 RepID=A0A375CC72_9BURK|nr:hypothetical protein CBM2587_B90132 [Cupriavidus taiwanensis]